MSQDEAGKAKEKVIRHPTFRNRVVPPGHMTGNYKHSEKKS